ncbi:hypothetical protein KUL152_17200 [Tenacibaculum sp. KUL152]|nr:hypothetical protein KUL152_17200 [Tenacibaculum sp. KUL152]
MAFNVTGLLSDIASLFYFVASFLLLDGLLLLNDSSIAARLKVMSRYALGVGAVAIVLAILFSRHHQAVASFAISTMFLLSSVSFSVQQGQALTAVRRFFKALLMVHAIVMVCQSVLLAFGERVVIESALHEITGVGIAAHIALCIITSVLLPFIVVLQQKEKWQNLANFDGLTGLYGRRAFIRQALEQLAQRAESPCTLMVIDIDHFKTINDQYGHPTGDRVLKVIATELRNEVEDTHIIGRLGGEEFAILVSNVSKLETFKLADVLRRKVEALEIEADNKIITVTISIGMTFSSNVEETWHTLFNRADTELYNAKARGRNQISPRLQVVA